MTATIAAEDGRADQALDDAGLRRVGRQRRREEADAALREDRNRPAEDVGDEHEQDRQRQEQASEQQDLEHETPGVAPAAR